MNQSLSFLATTPARVADNQSGKQTLCSSPTPAKTCPPCSTWWKPSPPASPPCVNCSTGPLVRTMNAPSAAMNSEPPSTATNSPTPPSTPTKPRTRGAFLIPERKQNRENRDPHHHQ